MMESLQYLADGFLIAMQPTNLMFALIGCLIGTFVGVIPGVGPTAGVSILLPVTFAMEPTPAIIMLAAIYYGAMYGGTITSVLMNVPGDAPSAVTCIEGHAMAKNGRAGPALAVAAIGSFIGGTFVSLAMVFVAIPITQIALRLGPPDILSLIILALCLVTSLAGRSVVRAGIAAGLGVLIASVGIDPVLGLPRFTFGSVNLLNGLDVVAVTMGLFGLGEILLNLENTKAAVFTAKLKSLMPTRQDIKDSAMPVVRGTVLGGILGFIPGLGTTASSFISYSIERRLSKTPEKWGQGMIAGVAGPETANNACANANLIPLFTLGVPGSAVAAIIMSAFMMHGLDPGPFMFQRSPEVVWAIIASFLIGNVILLILNLPFIPMWVSLLKIPYSILFALIVVFMVVGSYCINNNIFDVGVLLVFGVVGYLFRKLDIPLAPLVMTLILTPILETKLRQSLQISAGDFRILMSTPVSSTLLAISAAIVVLASIRLLRTIRNEEAEV
jgi:putative tricarboxylic transport membrane protein